MRRFIIGGLATLLVSLLCAQPDLARGQSSYWVLAAGISTNGYLYGSSTLGTATWDARVTQHSGDWYGGESCSDNAGGATSFSCHAGGQPLDKNGDGICMALEVVTGFQAGGGGFMDSGSQYYTYPGTCPNGGGGGAGGGPCPPEGCIPE
jgi:hypothetical protein